MPRSLQILSNIEALDAAPEAGPAIGLTVMDHRGLAFMRQCLRSDVVIIDNSEQRKLYLACLLRLIFRFRLVAVDTILRPPTGLMAKFVAGIKRLLLRRVDRFILYFKDTAGYERYYGLDRARIVYVPFKVNGRDEMLLPAVVPEGDHVLCAGRTLRDVETFVAALTEAGCPAILLQQQREILRAHGTAQYLNSLPDNVRIETDTAERPSSFIEFIARARIVVIPRYGHDIAATGISTYLVAMALGKCVVISRGPGADDVLTDQAVFVEPENPDALALAVRELWRDDAKRRSIASAGRRYAETCGGTRRLARDILKASVDLPLDTDTTADPVRSASG